MYTSIQHVVHIRYCSGRLTVTYRVHVSIISRTEIVYLSGSTEFTARLCGGVCVAQSLVVYVVDHFCLGWIMMFKPHF
jgi:hypothetical protein